MPSESQEESISSLQGAIAFADREPRPAAWAITERAFGAPFPNGGSPLTG